MVEDGVPETVARAKPAFESHHKGLYGRARNVSSSGATRLRGSMVRIAIYNTFWPDLSDLWQLRDSSIDVLFERQEFATARLIVFHIPTLQAPIDVPKLSGQQWVAWSMESEANYPRLADPHFMSQFDWTMTYRRDADVWTPYFGPKTLSALRQSKRNTPTQMAAYFASNPHDRSGRNDYVDELMKFIQVDSFGACLRNRSLLNDQGRTTKLATIASYSFTLAFENSIGRDYVTEKFFDPLIAGSIPVYFGAPNIADFAPRDDCFIDVRRFAGPKELALHLRSLDAADLARYHAWREVGPCQQFLRLVDATRLHPFCRLASLAASSGPLSGTVNRERRQE